MTMIYFRGVLRFVSFSVGLTGLALLTGCATSGDDTSDDSSAAATSGRSGNTPAGAGGTTSAAGEGGEAGDASQASQASQPSGGTGTGAMGGTSGAPGGVGGSSGITAGGSSGASMGGSSGGAGLGGVAGSGVAGTGTGGVSGAASTTCGNGMLDAGEACDASVGAADGTCSNTCIEVSNSTCLACENNGTCSDFVFNCNGPTASPFNAAQQTQCNTVLTCIQSSNCFDGTGTLGGTCYCGTLSLTDCQAAPFDLTKPGAPNGACAAVIQAGLPGISANSAVLGGLTASAKPAGAAMQRLNCQKTADSAACLGDCGFSTGGAAFP